MEECAPGGLNSDDQKNANPVRSSGAVDYGLEGKYKKRVKAERLLIPVRPSPPTLDTKHPVMDKNELVQKAKLAEQAERYDDMAACMN